MSVHDIIIIDDFLSVMVKGALSISSFQELTDEMLRVCRENDIHKIVIDVSGAAGTFSNEDKIEFAKYACDVLAEQVDKYAYVYPHELLDYSSQQIARGRGLNVRAYYDMEDALAWIEKP